MKTFFSRYGSLLVLAVMIVIMTVLSPNFMTLANLFNVSRQISVMAVVAFWWRRSRSVVSHAVS